MFSTFQILKLLLVVSSVLLISWRCFWISRNRRVMLHYGLLGLAISASMVWYSLFDLELLSWGLPFIGIQTLLLGIAAVLYLFLALNLTVAHYPSWLRFMYMLPLPVAALVVLVPWPWGAYGFATIVVSALLFLSFWRLTVWMLRATDERARRDGQWMILVFSLFSAALLISVFNSLTGIFWIIAIWYVSFFLIIQILRIFDQVNSLENQLIMDNVFDLVLITDAGGRIIRMNRRGYQLVKGGSFSVEDAGVETVFADPALTAETRSEWLRSRARHDSGGERTPSFDCLLIGTGGEEIPVDMRVVSLTDLNRRITGHIVSATDMRIMQQLIKEISDREYAARDLALSESKFSRMFIFNPAGILIIDPDSSLITDANPAVGEIFDREAESLIGHSMRDLGLALDEEHWHNFMELALLEGSVPEFPVTITPTSDRLLRCRVSAVSFELGEKRRVLVTVSDITREEQLREALERKKKLETIGFLAGGIAHDFNNILAVILGHIGLARFSLAGGPGIEAIMKAERACLRARELTGQLLTFSRGGKPIMEPCDTALIVRETIHDSCSGSAVTCSFDFFDSLWPLCGDRVQIGQVLSNIAGNAIEAMNGKGQLRVTLQNIECRADDQGRPRSLDGQLLPSGHYVEIRIRDTGPGVPKKIMSRLFDPFFTTKQKGSGLGLAIALSIVENHGGSIRLGHNGSDGAEFILVFPADPDGRLLVDTEEAELPSPATHSILVMDDDQLVLDTARSMLFSLGYRVVTASHGLEALDLYIRSSSEGFPFDYVILDLVVPGGLSGKDTAISILEYDPEAVLLVSSGYSDDPVLANWRKHGFRGVIPKPYTIEELSRALKALPPRIPFTRSGPETYTEKP